MKWTWRKTLGIGVCCSSLLVGVTSTTTYAQEVSSEQEIRSSTSETTSSSVMPPAVETPPHATDSMESDSQESTASSNMVSDTAGTTTSSKEQASTGTAQSSLSSSSLEVGSATSSSTSTTSSSFVEATGNSILPPTPQVIGKEELEENYVYSVTKNQTTEAFIQAIGEDAREIANDNELYASVMIAQAILETGSGNSLLASAPNYNLFGIKGSYDGNSVTFSTKEDDGSGSLYTVRAKFRKYPSYKESLEDYALLLTQGITGNSSYYAQTWKSKTVNYKEATAFLTGRYATDIHYGEKLNALIDTYELTQFDELLPEEDETTTSQTQSSEDETTDTTAASETVETTQQRHYQVPEETSTNIAVSESEPSAENVLQVPAKELAINK